MIQQLRRILIVLTLPLFVVAVMACANSTAPPETAADDSPPPTASHGLPADVIAMVLPATGAESRWTQGLDAFGQLVRLATSRECGLPEDGPPPAFIRLSDLPDLEFIERHGLTLSATPPIPDQKPSPRPAATADCQQRAEAAVKEFKELYAGLQSRWWRALGELRSHPQVTGTLDGLAECLDRHGISAATEQEFFAKADSRLMALDGTAMARADHELGAAYASCMRPVEAAREPLRAALRADFVAANQTEVDHLRQTMPSRIRELEQRHGIKFSYPVP